MTFALLSQIESAYTFAQDTDVTTKNNSNLSVSLKNITILDTKSKTQFSGLFDEKNSTVKTVTYTPKFLCGNVTSDEGPVRPGHYDTDISILNKQDYPIKILWNVIPNDDNSSNSIIKILEPESSTSITCRDILSLVTHSKNLLEGFVMLSLQIGRAHV